MQVPHPESFENFRGKGVKARRDSKTILVGRTEMLAEEGVRIPESIQDRIKAKESEGMTSLLVSLDRRLLGAVFIADTLREKARATIDKIRAEGSIRNLDAHR